MKNVIVYAKDRTYAFDDSTVTESHGTLIVTDSNGVKTLFAPGYWDYTKVKSPEATIPANYSDFLANINGKKLIACIVDVEQEWGLKPSDALAWLEKHGTIKNNVFTAG